MSQFDHSTQLQLLLDRLRAGDPTARAALLARAFTRVRTLARHMFRRSHPDLRVAVETDDLLQGAAVRLHRSLHDVRPDSVRHFFALAATQIRRELTDLARRHLGPAGVKAARMAAGGADSDGRRALKELPDREGEPADLFAWADFHEQAALLPEEEREVVGLLWYQGLSQSEAAAVLGVSQRTVRRRWRNARLLLDRALHGDWPGL
jgi:RNA polymerase sigma-70 factor (ECF subfamily)